MRHSEFRHNRKSPYLRDANELSSRMFSSLRLPSVEYDPCPETTPENNGLFGKMTSKVSGILKGLKSAVGSIGDILKNKDEENIFAGSVTPTKIEVSVRDVNSLPLQNHAITKINFTELSHILQGNRPKPDPTPSYLEKPPTTTINVSFGGSNASVGNNHDALNQSTFSFQSHSNSNSCKDSIKQRNTSGSSKHKIIKRKKAMNLKRVIHFWSDIYDEKCKKYSQATQISFSKSLKAILTEGLKKPIPVDNGVATVEFKKNPATGKFEANRIKKKRKTMEIETIEEQNIHDIISKNRIQIEKEKEVKPTLKKLKDNSYKRVSVGAAIAIKLSKQKDTETQKQQKRRSDIFVDKLGQSPKEEMQDIISKSQQKVKLRPRNLIFEEDKHNRSTDTDSGMGEVKLLALKNTKEQCSQTSGVKAKSLFKADNSVQTSPLRNKSYMGGFGSHSRSSIEETKEEGLSRQPSLNGVSQGMPIESSSDKSRESNNIQPTLSHSVGTGTEMSQEPKENTEIIPENKPPKIENNLFEAPKALSFGNLNNNSNINPISTEPKNVIDNRPIIQNENPQVAANNENRDVVVTKSLFSPKKIAINRISTPLKPIESSDPGKNSLKLVKPNPEQQPKVENKPVFDFLKQYESKASVGNNSALENNPFLITKNFTSPKGTENASGDANPFLAASKSAQLGILGIIERTSSDKKAAKDQDPKPTTNLSLFANSTTQPMHQNNVVGNNPIQNSTNGLFSNMNNSSSGTNIINPISNNNTATNVSANLFGNNLNASNYAPSTKPTNLFANNTVSNNLFKKDEMEITDNRSLTNNVTSNVGQSLFGPMTTQNNNALPNTLFSNKNNNMNSGGNSLFGPSNNNNNAMNNEMIPQQTMNNNVGFNNGFNNSLTNNLFGNNMGQQQPANNNLFTNSGSSLPFGNQNVNSQQASNNLFGPANNNGNSGFMSNQIPFKNSQPDNRLFSQSQSQSQSQTTMNLFGNNSMETTSNKMGFNNNQNPFGNNKPSEMQNNTNMNLFGGGNFMSQQFQGQPQQTNSGMNNHLMSNPNAQQDAANFLGLSKNNNTTNNNESNQQRVYRKIIQPTNNRNRERAAF